MGTTIWVLSKNKMTDGDDWDHSALFNALERLDLICQELGVPNISSFVDWTDFYANMAEDQEEFPSEDEIKKQALWFSPQEALPSLRAVREYLANNPSDLQSLFEIGLEHLADELIGELDDCISKIEQIDRDGDVFHLCVVM